MDAIEKRARELLATQFNAEGREQFERGQAVVVTTAGALNAITAALTPPKGYVLVPAEPTEEMIAAAEEAHMPFGDMGFAISAALAARPEVQ